MKSLLSTVLLFLICIIVIGCANDNDQEEADVDFTTLGATIAAAEFSNIFSNTSDYVGKTIRARGEHFSLYIDSFQRYFHYVTIIPAHAMCCPAEGFEFRLTEDQDSLDGFPAQGEIIEVTGVLQRSEEQGVWLIYLSVDEISVVD